jgi:hypothetical protein
VRLRKTMIHRFARRDKISPTGRRTERAPRWATTVGNPLVRAAAGEVYKAAEEVEAQSHAERHATGR